MAEKPADEEHPFGHGRMEYIAAFVVAFLVIQVGLFSFKDGSGQDPAPGDLKLQRTFSRNSGMFRAGQAVDGILQPKAGKADQFHGDDGNRSRFPGGCGATSATIVSLLVFRFFHINIDGIIGLVVSVLVLIAGVNIAKDTLAPLLGEAIDPEVYKKISDFVESYDGIIGSHDLIVHNYGPSRSMASIHAEVPSKVDIEVSHAVVDQIEAMR